MAWISEAQKHYEEYVDYYTSLLEDYVDDHILELAPAYGQLQEAAVSYLEEVAKKYVNEQNPDFVPTRRWAKKIQEEYLTKIIPVSYTHLDVYKRQLKDSTAYCRL